MAAMTCKAINIGLDALNVYDSVQGAAAVADPIETDAHQSRAVQKGMTVACQAAEVAGKALGFSTAALKAIKLTETFLNVHSAIDTAAISAAKAESATEFVLKGIVGPIADVSRTLNEFDSHRMQSIIDMTPEQREAASKERPDCSYDVKVAQARKDIADRKSVVYTGIRTVIELTPKLIELYGRLKEFIQTRYRVINSLLDLPEIPEILNDDIVFREFICPITQSPIRYPVKDPTDQRVYERAALLRWIQRHHTSPVTRRSLSERDLLACPEIQGIINRQLQMHNHNYNQYLQRGVQPEELQQRPPEQELQEARREDPRGIHLV